MPIYEYRCSACGFEKDALQKMSDPPLVECPQCAKSTLVKLVSAAGFQLKGSGWYATDFKNSGASKPAAAPKTDAAATDATKPAAAPGGDGSTGSSESKSAEKSTTTATESARPAAGTPPVTGTGD